MPTFNIAITTDARFTNDDGWPENIGPVKRMRIDASAPDAACQAPWATVNGVVFSHQCGAD